MWKKIVDEMPPEGVDVLVFSTWRSLSEMDVGSWFSVNGNPRWCIAGVSGGSIGKGVTHWMPLPQPPT